MQNMPSSPLDSFDCFESASYCDLHVAKLADIAEATSLLPEIADSLIAHRCFTVPERAAVSLAG